MKQINSFINAGKRTIQIEIEQLQALTNRIDHAFIAACELILSCEGRVIVLGMGKSGHIGNKIASTLASTGTPAFFVHPGEASHGDMGMITKNDLVLAISNSGTTSELITILPLIKRLGVPMISMTGAPNSTLASSANVHLNVSITKEACPLGLAPTSSTTAALVMGDALAVALLESRDFSSEDFALSHPGGALGRKLILKVADIMHTNNNIPIVKTNTPLTAALLEMTRKKLGMTAVVNQDDCLVGIFTDGDLRRTLDKSINIHKMDICEVMSVKCATIKSEQLAAEALHMMENNKINALIVVNETNQPVGALNMHDLLRAGII